MLDSEDVVVVAAGDAWPFYQLAGGYVCQLGRSFRSAGRMAFYSGRQIHGAVPRVLRVLPRVEMSQSSAARLSLSLDPMDRRVGDIVTAATRQESWDEGAAQVVVLSTLRSPETVRLQPVTHPGTHAWTQNQRYVRLGKLLAASTTGDLAVETSAERQGES